MKNKIKHEHIYKKYKELLKNSFSDDADRGLEKQVLREIRKDIYKIEQDNKLNK